MHAPLGPQSARVYRTGALILLFLIVLTVTAAVGTWQSTYTKLSDTTEWGEGLIDLSSYDFDTQKPLILSGKWWSGDGVAEPTVLLPYEQITLDNVSRTGTVFLRLPDDTPAMSLYLQTDQPDRAHVYVNGAEVQPRRLAAFGGTLYPFPVPEGEQIVVLTISFTGDRELMLLHAPVLGGTVALWNYMNAGQNNFFLLLGLFIALLIDSLLFVIIRPHHRLNTRIFMLDFPLGVMMLIGLPEAVQALSFLFPQVQWYYHTAQQIQMTMMPLCGICGTVMAVDVYAAGRTSKSLWGIYGAYAYLMAVFGLFPAFAPGLHMHLLFIVIFCNMVFLVPDVVRHLRKNRSGYHIVLAAKTVLSFGVMLLHLLILLEWIPPLINLPYVYIVAFLLHVLARLLDNDESYREVEKLTVGLESMVEIRTRQLTEANRRLAEMTIRDALTGAHNRLHFENEIQLRIEQCRKTGESLWMCILDLDHFKEVNDLFGHEMGDQVLAELVAVAQRSLPQEAMFARLGGEEFVILCRGQSMEEMYALTDGVREAIEKHTFPCEKAITASFGLSRYDPDMGYKDFFREVDRCLYLAKSGGRNRVAVAERLRA